MRITKLLLALLLAGNCHAQFTNSLLWRVQGPGQSKPSYLFGTLHKRDARLFQFKDSLYTALSACEGFAMEVDPEALANVMVTKQLQWTVQQCQRPSEPTMLSPASPAAAMAITKSPFRAAAGPQLMNHTMDLWLYQAAKGMGKWQGHVEELEDQLGPLEQVAFVPPTAPLPANPALVALQTKLAAQLERWYLQEKIDLLADFAGEGGAHFRQQWLVRRNQKMVARMHEFMRQRTMFVAVGVAHLAGPDGVLALLQAQGYSVEAVACRRRTPARSYHAPNASLRWTRWADGHLFKAVFPFQPATTIDSAGLRIHVATGSSETQYFAVVLLPMDIAQTGLSGQQWLQRWEALALPNTVVKYRKGKRFLHVLVAGSPAGEADPLVQQFLADYQVGSGE